METPLQGLLGELGDEVLCTKPAADEGNEFQYDAGQDDDHPGLGWGPHCERNECYMHNATSWTVRYASCQCLGWASTFGDNIAP